MISDRLLACLKAPGDGDEAALEVREDGFFCPSSGASFPSIGGIPSLYAPEEGESGEFTARIMQFYEENSFPGYEGLEVFGELVRKGRENPFSNDLLTAIGHNKRILECGCGTGQLSHFLQLNNNHVLGVDLSLPSLKLAVAHKARNGLARSAFIQMNINRLAVRDESFDVVISSGVLHHLRDPEAAFARIVKKVKPGGIVMVGLYNWYGRVMTWVRGRLIGLLGPRIDYVVRNRIRDPEKARVWVQDQYYHTHETWHSIDEVLGWFAKNGITFLNCRPPILGTDGEVAKDLFSRTDAGSVYQRVMTQVGWMGSIGAEGALFTMVGRKE